MFQPNEGGVTYSPPTSVIQNTVDLDDRFAAKGSSEENKTRNDSADLETQELKQTTKSGSPDVNQDPQNTSDVAQRSVTRVHSPRYQGAGNEQDVSKETH